ncbi:MAG: PA14 domain-containing protein [Anaerolineales bacterium]
MKKRFGLRVYRVMAFVGVIVGGLIAPLGAEAARAAEDASWYAEYFANPSLHGEPTLTRYERGPHFEWGVGSPGEGVPADNFSARLTHDEWFSSGVYRFSYRADDGIRVWVSDALVIDAWQDGPATWRYVDYQLPSGVHRVRIEYYERTGAAALQVSWQKLQSDAVWQADYYANTNFSGDPVLTRQDTAIDFDWGYGSPDPAVPADNFSVHWSRVMGFEAGTYRFYTSSDDGMRIYVDGHKVVDAWQKQKLPNTHYGDITLPAGQHSVIVQYFEEGGEASAHAWWNRLDQFTGWEGRYYDNKHLRGGPALIRDDAEINFDWGEGSPASWIDSDNFSAMWTRTFDFKPGFYRFNVRADDGVRVWLDQTDLRINKWEPQDFAWHYHGWHYLEGPHEIRVEYFEGTGSARLQFWWDYAATQTAAEAMAPSPTYGFATAPAAPQPTPAPTSPPAAAPATATNGPGPWRGEYFASRYPSGEPALVRTDEAIDFTWGWQAPDPALPVNNFSARWTGEFPFEAGRYRFTTLTDDGVRLYVNDELLIDSWRRMRGVRTGTIDLPAGTHTVRVEYFEAMQAAQAHVNWQRLDSSSASPPSTSAPSPATVDGAPGPWRIQYYDNRTLSGDPVLVLPAERARLNYHWGFGSPAEDVPKDNFSARFERTQHFEAGRYRFTTYSDDGVRLYIDDELIINSWRPMRGARAAAIRLEEGEHTIRLEYFEQSGVALVNLNWEPW